MIPWRRCHNSETDHEKGSPIAATLRLEGEEEEPWETSKRARLAPGEGRSDLENAILGEKALIRYVTYIRVSDMKRRYRREYLSG